MSAPQELMRHGKLHADVQGLYTTSHTYINLDCAVNERTCVDSDTRGGGDKALKLLGQSHLQSRRHRCTARDVHIAVNVRISAHSIEIDPTSHTTNRAMVLRMSMLQAWMALKTSSCKLSESS